MLRVIALAALLAPAAARADSSANLGVSVTVRATCAIRADALAFGSYDPIAGGQLDATASVAVTCTKGATATITLDQGEHAAPGSSDAAPLRRMTAGGAFLTYELYTDAARASAWGNTAATGQAFVAASSAPAALTVYGRIAGRQDVPAGQFSDVVVATVSF
jgi:spore coat protein U-like protein